MKIYHSVTDLVGHTPLLELHRLEETEKLESTILAKLEYLNPAGSAKDRVACSMIDDAEARGLLATGANFIPDTLDRSVYDEILPIRGEDAYRTGRFLARHEGFLASITSGAAVWAAVELARRPENRGKVIVTLLPDSGERYLSTPMFQE